MAVGGTVVHFAVRSSQSFIHLHPSSFHPFLSTPHSSFATTRLCTLSSPPSSILISSHYPLEIFQFIFFFFAIYFKGSGEETWNMYQISPPFFFRIFLLIVSFFNRMLRVIFLHKFIWNWKLQQMPRKNDTDRHGSPIIRSRVINLTKHMPQHHAKPMPCIISLYLSFPTCNLHSTVPSFFPILIPYSRQISSRSLSTLLSLRRCNVVVLAPV